MDYTIENITAKWQYDRAAGSVPQLIVCHICDGYYEGTKAHFLTTSTQVSSHYIVGQKGQICEAVPITKFACCNGTSTSSTTSTYFGYSTVPLVKKLGGNANNYSVSIECEGLYSQTKGSLTKDQLDALVWLIRKVRQDIKAQYGYMVPLDREHIVGHYEINPRTKPNCPGQEFPWMELMARLKAEEKVEDESGTQTVQTESGMYGVQVGAFQSQENAYAFMGTFQAMGYETAVYLQGGYYKVLIGIFTDKPEASVRSVDLKNRGYTSQVIQI